MAAWLWVWRELERLEGAEEVSFIRSVDLLEAGFWLDAFLLVGDDEMDVRKVGEVGRGECMITNFEWRN